jgi:hypothetical protein
MGFLIIWVGIGLVTGWANNPIFWATLLLPFLLALAESGGRR